MTFQEVRSYRMAAAFWIAVGAIIGMAFLVPGLSMAEAQVSATSRRPTVSRQLQSMRQSLTRIRRSMETLKQNGNSVNANVTDVKNSLVTLNQRVVTGALTEGTPTPTPAPARVIAASLPTSSYVAFDKYDGRRGQATVQHNKTGIVVWFRIYEAGKMVQDYTLNFPFTGRTSDQKSADTMVINNCMSQFYRAFDATDGTFFIYASADDSLGVLCASDVYAK